MSTLQPPAFWDNLQTVYLTSGALREAARRYYQPLLSKESFPDISRSATEILASYSPRDLQRLRRFSRRGGPDFSEIRFCSCPKACIPSMDPPDSQKQWDATARVTTHGPNFLQLLKASHIYPAGHRFPEGGETEPPANLSTIADMLSHDRPSSPQATEKEFEDFERAWNDIEAEQVDRDLRKYFTEVLEVGDSEDSKCEDGFLFRNLALLAEHVAPTVPYRVGCAHREALDPKICATLNKHIQPADNHELIAPNFFLEVYAKYGTKPMIISNRACYAGALGARAMQALRKYEKEEEQPIFDNNVYTISATLREGVLNLYAHHITDGDPQRYIMTRVARYFMHASQDQFQEGLTAYRNARQWAKNRRDELIAAANSRKPQRSGQQTAGSHVTPKDVATPDGLEEKTRKSDQGKAGSDVTSREDHAAPDGLEDGEKTQESDQGKAGTDVTPKHDAAPENEEKTQPSTTPAPASEPAAQGNVPGRKRKSDAGSEADSNKKARTI